MQTRIVALLAGAGIHLFPPPVPAIREHPGKTESRASMSVQASSYFQLRMFPEPDIACYFSSLQLLSLSSTRPVSPEARVNSSQAQQPLPASPAAPAPVAQVIPPTTSNRAPASLLLLAPQSSPGGGRAVCDSLSSPATSSPG